MIKPRGHREQGIALVTVIWALLLLSTVAAALMLLARSSRDDVLARRDISDVSNAAEAGVWQAILGTLSDRPEERWPIDGSERQIEIGKAVVDISITDESGRIDLNTAEDRFLAALFEVAGISHDDSIQLVDRVRDWADEDDLRRLHGAEGNEYRLARKSFMPQNRAFRKVEELSQVLGIDYEVFRLIEPGLTVYSGRYNVDPASAPPIVRKVLAVIEGAERPAVQSMGVGSLAGRALRIEATARTKKSHSFTIITVVRITGNPDEPYWILVWQQGMPLKAATNKSY